MYKAIIVSFIYFIEYYCWPVGPRVLTSQITGLLPQQIPKVQVQPGCETEVQPVQPRGTK